MFFTNQDISNWSVGFDEIMRQMDAIQRTPTNFPPYNIRKSTDNSYIIELALAGYKEKNLSITTKDNVLTVASISTEEKTDTKPEYQHKGLAARDFSRQFMLSKDYEVSNASFQDGLLSIHLKNIADKNTKTISINKSSK